MRSWTEVMVAITGDADTPSLGVTAAAGLEDSAVFLDVSAALTDTDGSETLSVVISGVPAGATLSAGTDNLDGSWTLAPADLAGLTITPPADFSGSFQLTVAATATEADGDTATPIATLNSAELVACLPAIRHIRGEQTRLLANAIVLEEAGPPRLLSQLLLFVATLIVGLLVWSGITQIPETVTAPGEVVPAGSVHVVQHLEGGIISEILAANGQLVEAGQPLIRLDPTASNSELEQMRAREAALSLRAERLRAFAEGRLPAFTRYQAEYPELVTDQMDIFEFALETSRNQRIVLRNQISQRNGERHILVDQLAALQSQADIIEEEYNMRKTLVERKHVSRILFLENLRELNRVRGEVTETKGKIALARLAAIEALNNLAEFESRVRNDALTEMGAVKAELAEVKESLAKLEDRVNRSTVVASVRGIVNGLEIATIGAVIAPGSKIMEIVPLDDEMIVEARITPSDIGHVEVGQKVDVKVSTFDFTQYGSISGHVDRISANSFTDQNGQLFYKVEILLDRNYVGNDPNARVVLPGMTAETDIVTGTRSLLQYMLKPARRSLNSAFKER